MKSLTNIAIFFILAFFCFISIKPVFISGIFPIHDDTQVARVYEMTKALKDGMFPVRWVSNLGYGYGYPIFNFYAPLAYYAGALFQFIGFDSLFATKLMMVFGFILSAISMFFLAKEFWGKMGGLISGLFYLYAPYHAVNLYVRGDVAEFWAYGFIPVVFLGIYKIYSLLYINVNNELNTKLKTKYIKLTWLWVAITAMGYSAIILSHNLSALMVTPFLLVEISIFVWFFIKKKNYSAIRYMIYALLIGILLSAFYWLPALSEMRFTNVQSQIGGAADYRLHFVCLNQLWDSPWGFGGSTPGCHDGISFRVGKLHIVLMILIAITLPFIWRENGKQRNVILISFVLLFFSIFLTLQSSKFIWDSVPLMKYFQYPWRFLLLISFFSSFIVGSFLWIIKNVSKSYDRYLSIAVSILIVLIMSITYNKLFIPQTIYGKTTQDYTSEKALKWTISKISDEYMPRGFMKPTHENDISQERVSFYTAGEDLQYRLLVNKTQETSFIVNSNLQTQLSINIAPFPAWKLTRNNEEYSAQITPKGYFVILPRGTNYIRFFFAQTPIEKAGNILSLIGTILLIIGIISSAIPLKRIKSYEKVNS